MTNHGFTHSYPSSDPVHFDYTAGGTIDLRGESVLAFQKLWNLNHPGDQIGDDGDYGPMTGKRVAMAPTDGFAKSSTCSTQSNPTPAPSMAPSMSPSPEPSTDPSMTDPSMMPDPSATPSPSPEPLSLAPETPEPVPAANEAGGCAVGGTADLSLFAVLGVLALIGGRGRRRDIP